MVEYLLTILVVIVIVYALVKGCAININVSVKQEFSSEGRQLLEDLFNKDGDPIKDDEQVSMDELIKNINSFMVGDEENK